jgi:hypothetical protein
MSTHPSFERLSVTQKPGTTAPLARDAEANARRSAGSTPTGPANFPEVLTRQSLCFEAEERARRCGRALGAVLSAAGASSVWGGVERAGAG